MLKTSTRRPLGRVLGLSLFATLALAAVPAAADQIYVVDVEGGTNSMGALLRVDAGTGMRSLVSDFGNIAQGPLGADPTNLALEASGTVLVLDRGVGIGGIGTLFRVNVGNGMRILVSDFGNLAHGPVLGVDPQNLAVEADGAVLVTDSNSNTTAEDGMLFRVDAVSGMRSLVSAFGNEVPGVPKSRTPLGLAVEKGGAILVIDRHGGIGAPGALFRVNGNRMLVSDFGNAGQGLPRGQLLQPRGVATEADGTVLVVTEALIPPAGTVGGALVRVNLPNGQRTLVSDFNDSGQGPLGGNLQGGLAVESGGTVLVTDAGRAITGNPPALFRVDRLTGQRTVLSDFSNGGQGVLGLRPVGVITQPPAADLALTKADFPDPVIVGIRLTYTITVTNNGPDAATGVVVTDTLPAGIVFVSATPSQGNCSGTATVTCNLGSLNNGANATATIVVTPTSAGAVGNRASVSGTEADPNNANNSATEGTTVNPPAAAIADLALTKTDSPDPVTVGNHLTYTIKVTNNGPDAATGVVVTDTLPAGVTFVSATPSQGNCSGTATVTCSLGALSAGSSAIVDIVVTPLSVGTITNTATVTASESEVNQDNNTVMESTTVTSPPVIPPVPPPVEPRVEAEPANPQVPVPCTGAACRVRITCNTTEGVGCSNRVNLFVRASAVRLADEPQARVRRMIRFASGIANIPPGDTRPVKLRLTKKGTDIAKKTNKKRFTGILSISNNPGTLISETRVRIRLR